MFVLQITAFIIMILCISWFFKESAITVLPVGVSLLILLLYILAFFQGLLLSDYIAIGILLTMLVVMVRASKEKRKALMQFAKKKLLSPEMIAACGMLLIVTICVNNKVVTWWDDYNFWATDVKSLFYLNGFADKYANVAVEFGDYPPGTQLFKWWFLHFSPKQFSEGLMFAGYYAMNLIFLFPLLKLIKHKNVLTMFAGAIMLWLLPAVAENFWCDGTCADLTMALVYGAFLVSVVDKEGHSPLFYYGRQGLFLMILVLCKNTGFIWVAIGLVFCYGYHIVVQAQEKFNQQQRKINCHRLVLVTAMPILAEGSWLLFCLLNRRVAKLTGTAVHMVTGSIKIPSYQEEMVAAFVEAFVKWPLHRWKTIGIDLSPLACYLLILLLMFILFRTHILDKPKAIFIASFFAVSGLVFYALNLFSHLTIFAVETQYLEPYGMVSSIERYGAPFTVGGLFLTIYLLMKYAKTDKVFAWCLLFVLVTTDLNSAWRALYGYRTQIAEESAKRNEIVDLQAQQFLEAIGAGEDAKIGRVLYLRDISDVSWVRNTYTGFEASPISVMYGNINTESTNSQDILAAIEDVHAEFVYVEKLVGNEQAIFEPLVDHSFEYGCLYQVIGNAQDVKLVKYAK